MIKARGDDVLAMDSDDLGYMCTLCDNDLADLVAIPGCQHTFCKSCIEQEAIDQIEIGEDVSFLVNVECMTITHLQEIYCPTCGISFDTALLKAVETALLKAVELPQRVEENSARQKKPSKKGMDYLGFLPRASKTYKSLQHSDASKEELYQSPKMKAVLAQVDTWIKEAPQEKFIIFTQWIPV